MASTSKIFGKQHGKIPHQTGKAKSGFAGEIGDLRDDIDKSLLALEVNGGLDRVEEFLALRAASANAIKLSIATATTAQSYTAKAGNLDGALGANEIIPPRNITVTSSSSADVTAVPIVITGKVRNNVGDLITQTDTITPTAGGGTTDAGTKPFSLIESIAPAAMGGATANLQFGIGVLVGLACKPRTAAGYVLCNQQVTDGALVTTGTFNLATLPNGTWTPAAAPNGTHNYALRYCCDGA
jgi:hypothetical protein